VKFDSRGVFRFDAMLNEPRLYGKYEAYIIGSTSDTSVQLHFGGKLCVPVIVEVS